MCCGGHHHQPREGENNTLNFSMCFDPVVRQCNIFNAEICVCDSEGTIRDRVPLQGVILSEPFDPQGMEPSLCKSRLPRPRNLSLDALGGAWMLAIPPLCPRSLPHVLAYFWCQGRHTARHTRAHYISLGITEHGHHLGWITLASHAIRTGQAVALAAICKGRHMAWLGRYTCPPCLVALTKSTHTFTTPLG